MRFTELNINATGIEKKELGPNTMPVKDFMVFSQYYELRNCKQCTEKLDVNVENCYTKIERYRNHCIGNAEEEQEVVTV